MTVNPETSSLIAPVIPPSTRLDRFPLICLYHVVIQQQPSRIHPFVATQAIPANALDDECSPETSICCLQE